MSLSIEYQDVEIEVAGSSTADLRVRLLNSPYGRPESVFHPPFDQIQIKKLLMDLESVSWMHRG